MENYIKVIAGVLITAIIYLILSKRDKDISILLTLAACCMVFTVAFYYLKPILNFFDNLQRTSDLNPELLKILLQAVGVCLLSEIASLVCNDIGNAALGKSVQIMSAALVLYLSLPLFQKLMSLIAEVLGEI